MILDIDPNVDYAFKRVYGREENRDVLGSILEAVLAGTEFGKVTDLEILNPFNERDTIDDKLSVVDVRARQKSGEVFNIEMQLLPLQCSAATAALLTVSLVCRAVGQGKPVCRTETNHRDLLRRLCGLSGTFGLPLAIPSGR